VVLDDDDRLAGVDEPVEQGEQLLDVGEVEAGRFGISTLTSLRSFRRAPCTRIRSWLSAMCSAGCAFSSRGNASSRPTIPPRAGPSDQLSPQLTAFFTSAAIFASSAAVNSFSAKATGHRAPLSRFAASLKPNVAYLVLNFCALWKKQTTLPS
jgi:hypothetical protein